MKISIEYCGVWNYEPKAVGLAAKIKERFGLEAGLVRGSGGVFEVSIDAKLVYSKKQTGQFPEDRDIFEAIQKAK